MKKNLIKFLFLSVIIFTISFSASAQVYVKIRPAAPVVVRSAQPDKSQVWIDEQWEPNGSTYRYAGGHWASPPHPGYRWKQGHWRRHHKDGEEWVSGSWGK
jgi:hypothetical protein